MENILRALSIVEDSIEALNNAEKDIEIQLESFLKVISRVKMEYEDDSSQIRKEMQEVMDSMEQRDDSPLIYLQFEDKLKESIQSQFSSIIEIILQIDDERAGFPKLQDLSESQWAEINQNLKMILTKKVHDKSVDLNSKISENFNDIRNFFSERLKVRLENKFEQNAVNLGLNKMFIGEFNKFHNVVDSKIIPKFIEKWKELTNIIGPKVAEIFKDPRKDVVLKMEENGEILSQIVQDFFKVDIFKRFNSNIQIKKQISNIINNAKEEIIIIVPKINDFIPLEQLKNSSTNHPIKIASSDSHKSEIIKEIKTYPNVTYRKIKRNKIIALKGTNEVTIGTYAINLDQPEKSINGYRISSKELIETINPIIIEKFNQGKFSKLTQIANNFNFIIQHINDVIGNEISELLQDTLNLTLRMKGISLNILDIKLLISKTKKMSTPIDDELKQSIIERIKTWNKDFSIALVEVPELLESIPEEEISMLELPVTEEEIVGERPFEEEEEAIKEVELDKIESLFDVFFERIKIFKGSDLSNEIQLMINSILKYQGYSIITTWKNELRSVEEKLEEPFRVKLKEDFIKWKDDILQGNVAKKLIQEKPGEFVPVSKSKAKAFEEDWGDYVSPGMAQEQNPSEASVSSSKTFGQASEYTSPGLNEAEFSDDSSTTQKIDVETPLSDKASQEVELSEDDKLSEMFDHIIQNIDTQKGNQISQELQDIADILVEGHGYMASKDTRPWISKLRSFRGPLEDEFKGQFLTAITNMKNHYVKGNTGADDLDLDGYTPGFAMEDVGAASSITVETTSEKEGSELSKLFNKVIESAKTAKGNELTSDLQDIADIVMTEKGALSARAIRPWVSKLRAIREPLGEELKANFIQEMRELKEKFC
jgi:hypothetical protein